MPEFVDGLFVNKPSEKAPEFVKVNIGVQKEKFIKWLKEQEGDIVNIQINESKKGTWYGQLDTFKPKSQQNEKQGGNFSNSAENEKDDFDDSLPF